MQLLAVCMHLRLAAKATSYSQDKLAMAVAHSSGQL